MARTAPLLLLVLLLGACGDPAPRPETAMLDEAVALALPAFDGARKGEGPYRLIGARQNVVDGHWIWRVTFKAEKHLPADPSKDLLTAGGEIFVDVDPKTKQTTIRYGE